MNDDRIVNYADYGRHIPLRCKNHPDKKWSTKNILYIGARTIFYNLHRDEEMGAECACSINDLIPFTIEEAKKEEQERGSK